MINLLKNKNFICRCEFFNGKNEKNNTKKSFINSFFGIFNKIFDENFDFWAKIKLKNPLDDNDNKKFIFNYHSQKAFKKLVFFFIF